MKISGARADGALFLDLGVSAYILKGDRISAPTDRDVIAAMGPWTEVPRDPARRRQVAQRLDRATLAPLACFTLGGPGSGNFGHAGRPGEQGGSSGGGGGSNGNGNGNAHERTSSPGSGNFAGRKRPLSTPQLARSAGADEANRRMRAAGRTTWNEDDYNKAVRERNRVADTMGETGDYEDRLVAPPRTPAIEGKPPGRTSRHGPSPDEALKRDDAARDARLGPEKLARIKEAYTGKPIIEREAREKAFRDKLHAASQAKRTAERAAEVAAANRPESKYSAKLRTENERIAATRARVNKTYEDKAAKAAADRATGDALAPDQRRARDRENDQWLQARQAARRNTRSRLEFMAVWTGENKKKLSDDPREWPRPTAIEIERKVLELRAIDAAATPLFGGKAAPPFKKKLSDAPEDDATPTKAIVIGKEKDGKKPMKKAALVVKPTQAATALVATPQKPKALAIPAATPPERHAAQ